MEDLGGGIRRGDRQRTPALAPPIDEEPQDELAPVTSDDNELCEGDAVPPTPPPPPPPWLLPVQLAGLAQRASKDEALAGDGDRELLEGGYDEAACNAS